MVIWRLQVYAGTWRLLLGLYHTHTLERQDTGAVAHSQGVRALLAVRLRLRVRPVPAAGATQGRVSLVRLGLTAPVRPLLLALVLPGPRVPQWCLRVLRWVLLLGRSGFSFLMSLLLSPVAASAALRSFRAAGLRPSVVSVARSSAGGFRVVVASGAPVAFSGSAFLRAAGRLGVVEVPCCEVLPVWVFCSSVGAVLALRRLCSLSGLPASAWACRRRGAGWLVSVSGVEVSPLAFGGWQFD